MNARLDTTSKATIGRFVWKVQLALAVSVFFKGVFLDSVAQCLGLWGILMAIVAWATRQPVRSASFNHWSETLWLLFGAAGAKLLIPYLG